MHGALNSSGIVRLVKKILRVLDSVGNPPRVGVDPVWGVRAHGRHRTGHGPHAGISLAGNE